MASIWEKLFGPCKGCTGRDYHIASLKEQLRARELEIESILLQYNALVNEQNEKIEHMLGMNRNRPIDKEGNKLVSMPRRSNIQSRIAHAEAIDRASAGPIIAEREREYRKRIEELEKPELEVMEPEEKKDALG